ncbi:uncharacterized protein LOC133738979 [Rosa rugosa]|uniref:uncharacterized protein LOC133738979 n=1 Tax=Rosa rugosa TaxID=74645 RepID=UPI002B4119E1|nr:uncharacterized protein LOC133738979 [Rosa rugosa]
MNKSEKSMNELGRSAQLHELWRIAFVGVLWSLWRFRNKVKYDGACVNVTSAFQLVSGQIISSGMLASGWVKLNMDGAWRNASAQAGYRGIFHDFRGHVIGAFHCNLDIPSSIATEVMAVIKVIELAWVCEWK